MHNSFRSGHGWAFLLLFWGDLVVADSTREQCPAECASLQNVFFKFEPNIADVFYSGVSFSGFFSEKNLKKVFFPSTKFGCTHELQDLSANWFASMQVLSFLCLKRTEYWDLISFEPVMFGVQTTHLIYFASNVRISIVPAAFSCIFFTACHVYLCSNLWLILLEIYWPLTFQKMICMINTAEFCKFVTQPSFDQFREKKEQEVTTARGSQFICNRYWTNPNTLFWMERIPVEGWVASRIVCEDELNICHTAQVW